MDRVEQECTDKIYEAIVQANERNKLDLWAMGTIDPHSLAEINWRFFYGSLLTQADDGISGADWDRDGFNKILANVEQGASRLW